MKRKEIWIGVIIDTEDASDAFDDAYIFNSQEEAVEWARGCKQEVEEEIKGFSIYIGRISMGIDYARSSGDCRAMKCPIGPQGLMGKIIKAYTNEFVELRKQVQNKIQQLKGQAPTTKKESITRWAYMDVLSLLSIQLGSMQDRIEKKVENIIKDYEEK